MTARFSLSNFLQRLQGPCAAAALSCMMPALVAAQAAPQNPSEPAAEKPAIESSFSIGLGAAYAPRYSGSDESIPLPLLAAEYHHSSGLFASTLKGIGYGGTYGPIAYSASVGYRGPRYDHRKKDGGISLGSDYLRGMGEVRGGAVGNLTVAYSALPWLDLQLRTEQALTQRTNGSRYGIGATAKMLNDASDTISITLGVMTADAKYMQTYYGVTPTQASRTAFAVYTPKAGLQEAEMGINWQHRFSKSWSVTGAAGAQQLLSDAANSPLVRRKTMPVAALYVSYSF